MQTDMNTQKPTKKSFGTDSVFLPTPTSKMKVTEGIYATSACRVATQVLFIIKMKAVTVFDAGSKSASALKRERSQRRL